MIFKYFVRRWIYYLNSKMKSDHDPHAANHWPIGG